MAAMKLIPVLFLAYLLVLDGKIAMVNSFSLGRRRASSDTHHHKLSVLAHVSSEDDHQNHHHHDDSGHHNSIKCSGIITAPEPCSSSSTSAPLSRRGLFSTVGAAAAAAAAVAATTTATTTITPATVANAAPPISIIAEELGYFPVTNKAGETVYVPKRVQRESSPQAARLAELLRQKGVVMAGTYWCPHTSRQKELFGRQAWETVRYVECSPKGFNGNPSYCIAKHVEGYPSWVWPSGKQLSGERPLSVLAKEVGMTDFREELEVDLPGLPGSSCK